MFGFDEAHSVEDIDKLLPPMLANRATLAYPLAATADFDARVRGWLDAVRMQGRAGCPPRRPRSTSAHCSTRCACSRMRANWSRCAAPPRSRPRPTFVRCARRATACASITSKPNCSTNSAATAPRAWPTTRSSPRAPTLACCTTAGPAELRDGDLCLIDAGCELDGYASDITRTFPVNGRFTPAQRELYDLVQAAQDAAIAETRAGVPYNVPHDAAVRVLAQGMLDTGLLDRNKEGTLDDVLASGSYRRFYMHRTGHWLGMDVHDVGEYRVPGPLPAGHEGERPWRPLEAGMVVTIEPGIYVRPAEDVPERYWHIGIRIEDDAVVTSGDCELITRGVPVKADEIEALMRDNGGMSR
jgi:Xaa-Pro aminopeptidase